MATLRSHVGAGWPILLGVSLMVAGIAVVGLLASSNASQEPRAAVNGNAGEPHWLRCDAAEFDLLESGRQSRLDPGLAGIWCWEADSLYVPGCDGIVIKSTSTLTIDRDGGFTLLEAGVRVSRGRFVQRGDSLTGYCDDGQSFTTEFALDGSDGLWLAGRFYGRQQPKFEMQQIGNPGN